jgi:hypothetical protein
VTEKPAGSRLCSCYPFDRQCNSLPTTNAERDDSLADSIALHRVQETRREHRSRYANRVTMRNGAPFDIDNIFRQTKVLRDCKRNGGESLIKRESLARHSAANCRSSRAAEP